MSFGAMVGVQFYKDLSGNFPVNDTYETQSTFYLNYEDLIGLKPL